MHFKELGPLKGVFKPLTNLCKGLNNANISNEEDTKNRWETQLQDLLFAEKLNAILPPIRHIQMK
jgi:hypothetical protein